MKEKLSIPGYLPTDKYARNGVKRYWHKKAKMGGT